MPVIDVTLEPPAGTVITNAFIMAKENYRIGAQILRDNKILRPTVI
jgi:hypothetical protein